MKKFLNHNFSTELNEIFNAANQTIKVEKGSYLFQEGMKVTEMYIMRTGVVRLSKISADGKELTLSVCSSGDIVNEVTLYTSDTTHLLNAIAIESAEVLVIKKDYLEEQLKSNSQLAFEYLKWMSDHFRKTQTKFRDLMLYGKKGALFSTIIRLTNKYGLKVGHGDDILINFALTDHELALFCGTTRETVNRLLNDLRIQGVLSKSNERIIVHDIDYLRDEISCENCSAEVCTI